MINIEASDYIVREKKVILKWYRGNLNYMCNVLFLLKNHKDNLGYKGVGW